MSRWTPGSKNVPPIVESVLNDEAPLEDSTPWSRRQPKEAAATSRAFEMRRASPCYRPIEAALRTQFTLPIRLASDAVKLDAILTRSDESDQAPWFRPLFRAICRAP